MRWIPLLVVSLLPLPPALAITPVADFELARYYGTWYEIASIPRAFQHRCARDTQAEYTPAEQGAIAMRNQCKRADGQIETAEGHARPLEPALPSVLKLTSVHLLGMWWYPFGREYVVVALGPDYRWAAVGDPSLRYGRILSRQPSLSDAALRTAADALAAEGYDLCAFTLTPQTGGREREVRLCDVLR